jgi:twitching motility protein PilT
MLANTLVAIISLRLLPNKEGTGRAPAAEIMINTPTIKEYLVDLDKINLIESAIAEGFDQHRSQTFDQSVYSLYKDDMITYEVAIRNATNPNDFDLKVKGIESTSDRSWM